MSNWLSKSNQSFEIANNTGSPMLNNRVHCYYYGCVQLMFHLLNTKFGMTIETISEMTHPMSKLNPGNGGTHVWLNRYFSDDLKRRTHHLDGLNLNNHLGKLKRLRTDADYGHDDMIQADIIKANEFCTSVQAILTKRYT
jgi:hypothetical protein